MENPDLDLFKHPTKRHSTIGACGLDCGLCTRFYTAGPSRCPGCAGPGFHKKHPTCSFITCCVKKRNLEVCAGCSDFPCTKFKSAEEYEQVHESSSYPSRKKILPNLYLIKEQGIKNFLKQQRKRIKLLEAMIAEFDDGRSRSFFCKTAIFRNLTELEMAIKKARDIIKTDKIKRVDVNRKAKILKSIICEIQLAE